MSSLTFHPMLDSCLRQAMLLTHSSALTFLISGFWLTFSSVLLQTDFHCLAISDTWLHTIHLTSTSMHILLLNLLWAVMCWPIFRHQSDQNHFHRNFEGPTSPYYSDDSFQMTVWLMNNTAVIILQYNLSALLMKRDLTNFDIRSSENEMNPSKRKWHDQQDNSPPTASQDLNPSSTPINPLTSQWPDFLSQWQRCHLRSVIWDPWFVIRCCSKESQKQRRTPAVTDNYPWLDLRMTSILTVVVERW